jgi:hypothetical protein
MDKASYLIAVRQFDSGLEELEAIITNKEMLEKSPLDWERAVRTALTIAVRVKRDPDLSLRLVNRAIGMPNAPTFFSEQIAQWKRSIESWKTEATRQPASEEGFYAELVRLTTEAKSLQKYSADHSGDIVFLRASSIAHDLLGAYPDEVRSAEPLYLAGLSYEVMEDLGLWDLHEFYYLACIKKSPHSETARCCYRQYERSIYFGYTGSSGTSIPWTIQQRLKELNVLSEPLKPIQEKLN